MGILMQPQNHLYFYGCPLPHRKGANMATSSVTDKQYRALVAELKKHPGNSERHYAETTGIALPQIGSVLYKAELEADPSLKIAKTAKAVAQARRRVCVGRASPRTAVSARPR
jgi:hypothetical protein